MKRKLFWIVYFGLFVVLITIAALLMQECVVLNWFSLLPIVYILICAFLAWFFPSKYNARLAIWSEEQSRIKWGNKPLDAPYLSEKQLIEMGAELHGRLSKACLAFIPAFAPFAFFYQHGKGAFRADFFAAFFHFPVFYNEGRD